MAARSSMGSGYCITKAKKKARTGYCCEFFHHRTSVREKLEGFPTNHGENIGWNSTTSRWGYSYSHLHVYICKVAIIENAINTMGNRDHYIQPKTERNRLGNLSLWAHHLYIILFISLRHMCIVCLILSLLTITLTRWLTSVKSIFFSNWTSVGLTGHLNALAPSILEQLRVILSDWGKLYPYDKDKCTD